MLVTSSINPIDLRSFGMHAYVDACSWSSNIHAYIPAVVDPQVHAYIDTVDPQTHAYMLQLIL